MIKPVNRVTPSIKLRQLLLRQELWPNLSDDALWLRKKSNGFTTMPRTMPFIMNIMDKLS